MNKWKTTFIFLSGVWLHEFLTHLWISGEGLLPFTSKLFGITLTDQLNVIAVAVNGALLIIFGYLGFFRRWRRAARVDATRETRARSDRPFFIMLSRSIHKFAYLTLTVAVTLTGGIAYAQRPQLDLRAVLERSCSLSDDQLARIDTGKLVVKALKSRDKKEISLCGIVRLDRATPPTLAELRESLSQKNNRSVLAGGPFSEPPNRLDLQTLRLEKKDLDALLECRAGKCNLLVSDTLLRTLSTRSNWQPGDLEDLYAEDLTGFVRTFKADGIAAMRSFDGLSISVPLREQNRTLIDRVPLLGTLAPGLFLYVKEYPARTLVDAETKLSWSKINFGLKPIVTITSTTSYAGTTGDGFPAVVTRQIYASRYMNGSVALTAVVPNEEGRLNLIFADISRSDAMGGLFGGIKRDIVTNEGVERVKNLLIAAKTRLDTRPDASASETPPTRSGGDATATTWLEWRNATGLIAGIGAIVLIITGIRAYRRRAIPSVSTNIR